MIETEDLSKAFDGFWAVNGISLKVEPGQVLALLGQNGAGKTTTVRLLTAILRPTRGWARVYGYDVATQDHQVRASIGVLTEQHGLYLRMTAREYLDFFGKIYGLSPQQRVARRDQLLEYFGLTSFADRRIGEYSKGMKQKLALARALIHDPPVLLLDEPTSAMDPESARLVREYIASLKSSQRTIVLCTHNLIEAEMLADRVAIIYRGRILIQGSLEELKETVLGPREYHIQLAQPWNWDGFIPPSGATLLHHDSLSLRFRVDRPQQINPLLIRALIAHQAPLVAVQEVPRSLEQVYLRVMEREQRETV